MFPKELRQNLLRLAFRFFEKGVRPNLIRTPFLPPAWWHKMKSITGTPYRSASDDHITLCGTVLLFIFKGISEYKTDSASSTTSQCLSLSKRCILTGLWSVYSVANQWLSLSILIQLQSRPHMHSLLIWSQLCLMQNISPSCRSLYLLFFKFRSKSSFRRTPKWWCQRAHHKLFYITISSSERVKIYFGAARVRNFWYGPLHAVLHIISMLFGKIDEISSAYTCGRRNILTMNGLSFPIGRCFLQGENEEKSVDLPSD